MPFNSISYILFFSLVVTIYYLLNQNYRKHFLLLSSLFFVGYKNIESIYLLLATILFTYYLAKKIGSTIDIKKRKYLLRLGVFISISTLFLFKYIDIPASFGFDSNNLIFTLGISFYTLQNISFLLEVHSNRLKTEYNLIDFSVYSTFFPKFIMGPITIPQDFLPQINSDKPLSSNLTIGIQRILLGLVKKIAIADSLAEYVKFNFEKNHTPVGFTALLISYLFTIQLYFDFSGYSDIALGSAKALGFDLKENFNFPLRSKSITEFWRKWHISLTSWLTKYVFYTVSYRFRKLKKAAIPIALLVTFLLSGIWHGVGICFFIYAISHSLYMIIEYFTKSSRLEISTKIPTKIHTLLSIFITFNLVSLSFVFFRATSINNAFHLIKNVFSFKNFLPTNWKIDVFEHIAITSDQFALFNLFLLIITLSLFLLFEKKIYSIIINPKTNYIFIFILILILMIMGTYSNPEQFIYNRF